jgi:hypothetical protein
MTFLTSLIQTGFIDGLIPDNIWCKADSRPFVELHHNPMMKRKFLRLMHYPSQWMDWGMYPDELFDLQMSGYKAGDERGMEHERNGAFHWWLRRNPTTKQLLKLISLTYLDPDELMAADVRRYIAKAAKCDPEILRMLHNPPK